MVENHLNWMVGGQAGYGIMSTGAIFGRCCSRAGLNIFASTEYPSLIRGGHNTFQIRVSDQKVNSTVKQIDLLIALNEETITQHKNDLAKDGAIVYDSNEVKKKKEELNLPQTTIYEVPMQEITNKLGLPKIMRNNVALGITFALLNFDLKLLNEVIEINFGKKSKDIAKQNISAAQAGYDFAKKHFEGSFKTKLIKKESENKKIIVNGNDAFCLGAIQAGCKFVTAYPMTPATTILLTMAHYARKFNILVKQPEDEISAVNMALGAAYTGVRSMTATSGGGFALMSESLGLASIAEIPIVIVETQRPGPATGLPTRQDQGDLRFVLHAAQGEGPRIVIAPGDVDECFYEGFNAFNLAEKYQMPIVFLSDKHLASSYKNTNKFDLSNLKINRGLLLPDKELLEIKDFKRFKFTENGISPRSIPGQANGIHKITGNESDEFGYISEDKQNRVNKIEKRNKKIEEFKKELPLPKIHGDEQSKITLVSWGSTKGAILDAMKLLEKEGIKTRFLQLIYLNPFPDQFTALSLEESNEVILIENNSTAQLAGLIREKTGFDIKKKILKYDGRPFYPSEIYAGVKQWLN